jgi:hypothetical protein
MYFSQRGQLGKICEGILLAKFFVITRQCIFHNVVNWERYVKGYYWLSFFVIMVVIFFSMIIMLMSRPKWGCA